MGNELTLYRGEGKYEDNEDYGEEHGEEEDNEEEHEENDDDEAETEENRDCFYCGQNGHLQYDCELYNEERDLLWCTMCNRKGHDDESCYECHPTLRYRSGGIRQFNKFGRGEQTNDDEESNTTLCDDYEISGVAGDDFELSGLTLCDDVTVEQTNKIVSTKMENDVTVEQTNKIVSTKMPNDITVEQTSKVVSTKINNIPVYRHDVYIFQEGKLMHDVCYEYQQKQKLEVNNNDEQTLKLQHLWNNHKLFDWGSEGDVDENKKVYENENVFVKNKIDIYVKEENDVIVEEKVDRYV